jgi:4-hydroxybenzoate polyprenyltransferase
MSIVLLLVTVAMASLLLVPSATARFVTRRLVPLMLSLSLCYVAGMFLNDAFDREFDARHRPERPPRSVVGGGCWQQ